MASPVVRNFGNVVLPCREFIVPHSTTEVVQPERAWARNQPVFVTSLDFIRLLQKSPIFQVPDGTGMTRRAEIRVVKKNSNHRHALFFEVTNVLAAHKGCAEGFLGVCLAPKTEAAKSFIREHCDAVLDQRARSCACGMVTWLEQITPRCLMVEPQKFILKFTQRRPHFGCTPCIRTLKAEINAFKQLSASPCAVPSMVDGCTTVPVTSDVSEQAAAIVRHVGLNGSPSAKSALMRGRNEHRSGLPPFSAVSVALNKGLDDAIDGGTLDDLRTLYYAPALDTATDSVSVLSKQLGGIENYTEFGPKSGLHYDDKINATQSDGLALTVYVVTKPVKPKVALRDQGQRKVIHCNMLKTQHISIVAFTGATTCADADYFMKNRVVIVENLPCTNPECQHRTAVKTRSASSQPGNISKGFVLWKPECVSNWSSFPPKTHDTEVIDMCSASMSSHYRYRRNPCTPLRLKRLVLCYYHSVNAYAEAAIKRFGIGANPCLLGRAQRPLPNSPRPRSVYPLILSP